MGLALLKANKDYAVQFSKEFDLEKVVGGGGQDGGGIGRGDHFLFYKFIERTTER